MLPLAPAAAPHTQKQLGYATGIATRLTGAGSGPKINSVPLSKRL